MFLTASYYSGLKTQVWLYIVKKYIQQLSINDPYENIEYAEAYVTKLQPIMYSIKNNYP